MTHSWHRISALVVLAGLQVLAWPVCQAVEVDKPNVILILADDLGAKELACYGNKEHQTPHLDKMAAEGLRFETFYAMPLCTPTRVCLMTGQYGFRNGYLGMSNKAYVPLPGSEQQAIGNHFTHADLMKSAGYATAMAGKWQLSGKLPTLIHDAGFDEYRMWAYDYNLPEGIKHPAHEGGKGSNTSRYWHPSILENGKYLPTTADDFGPDLFNEFVLDFARRHAHEPFFVYYTSVLTHGPRVETPDPTQPGQRRPAGLKSNLEYLDYLMGKLISGLKELNLDQRTVVIFVGDNGTAGEGKGTATELGARVPCIVRGPQVVQGKVTAALADLTDVFPTLVELAGAKVPQQHVLDGKSLVPLLHGKVDEHRPWIYSHLDDGRVVREPRWLLEVPGGGQAARLYDCGTNRDGTGYRDVSNSHEPEVEAARKRLEGVLASMPQPVPHPLVEGGKPARARQPKSAD